MNILYIGYSDYSTTSYHRFSALERLGHHVTLLDRYEYLNPILANTILGKFHYVTGYHYVQAKMAQLLHQKVFTYKKLDLIWVDNGELFGPQCLKILRKLGVPIILYNIDDPTGERDGNRFLTLRKSLSFYDLCVVVRDATYRDFIKLQLPTLKVTMSYDEIAHLPYDITKPLETEFISDIAFVGTWIKGEKRDEFLLSLIEDGLNISIWGDRWQKSKYWSKLKKSYKGKALKGQDYVKAIQGAKISLGLLSQGNRDTHTTRSFEIPFIGGLLCAQRTDEHLAMFKEKEEAVFWENSTECANICKWLLKNESKRLAIQSNGFRKVRQLKVGNEDICKKILSVISQK